MFPNTKKNLCLYGQTLSYYTRKEIPSGKSGLNSLVAGGDQAGYQDGAFSKARFNNPNGLSLSETEDKLFVADSLNHRIRVVDLDDGNNVETLAGTGVQGKDDGPLEKATFNLPTRLATLSDNRLAVYDEGSHHIRIIDLKAKSVSTVPGDFTIWDMAYYPKNDSLYLSEPDSKRVERLILKSSAITIVFSNNPQVPSPQAICINRDKLFVADQNLPTVYEMNLEEEKPSPGQKAATLMEVGNGDHIQEMAFTGSILYAIQAATVPLVRVNNPKSIPVSLGTFWALPIDNENTSSETFLSFSPGQPVGFIASPHNPRKFYISKSCIVPSAVISFKDYDYGQYYYSYSNTNPFEFVEDYRYPAEKSRGTFRILLSGDSRTFVAPTIRPGPPYDQGVREGVFTDSLRDDTFPKQMEMFLNTEAALRGVKMHYEVLEWNRQGFAFSQYACYEIPPLVKKYNIDLVLVLTGNTGYPDYFTNPITADGIPTQKIDPEFMLKPLSKRIPPIEVVKDLYERYLNKTKTNIDKNMFPAQGDPWSLICSEDPMMRKDMIEMEGRRIQRMFELIQPMKTQRGNSPDLILFYVPYRGYPSCAVNFWSDLCAQYHFHFLDLSESYDALKLNYYPAVTRCCDGHFTAYGAKLVGYLLSHYLVEDKLIPFETPIPKKKS